MDTFAVRLRSVRVAVTAQFSPSRSARMAAFKANSSSAVSIRIQAIQSFLWACLSLGEQITGVARNSGFCLAVFAGQALLAAGGATATSLIS
jgi:hypothetical protein